MMLLFLSHSYAHGPLMSFNAWHMLPPLQSSNMTGIGTNGINFNILGEHDLVIIYVHLNGHFKIMLYGDLISPLVVRESWVRQLELKYLP